MGDHCSCFDGEDGERHQQEGEEEANQTKAFRIRGAGRDALWIGDIKIGQKIIVGGGGRAKNTAQRVEKKFKGGETNESQRQNNFD